MGPGFGKSPLETMGAKYGAPGAGYLAPGFGSELVRDNCVTKCEADFGIAPHFLGFLDPKSHVIWASRRGCDFIQSLYKREGADFDIAPI